MADLILPKIEPPQDKDRISYDEAKQAGLTVIGNGSMPNVAAIEPKLTPGKWHVEMRNHGLSLGAVANGFSSRQEAQNWAQWAFPFNGDVDRYGGYGPHCIYTPTDAELQMLDEAPRVLDLPCYVVKLALAEATDTGREHVEYWATKKEALNRVASLRDGAFKARFAGRMITCYDRSVEDLKFRSAHLDLINGEVRRLRDGSVWRTPALRKHCPPQRNADGHQQKRASWVLHLYSGAQLRTFYSEFYSAKRVLACSEKIIGYSDKRSATEEGLRLMASGHDYSAMSVWHEDHPSSKPQSASH